MIAYHFPPVAGSSGVLRTLKFSKYLPECGWQPIVLSVTPGAYADRSSAQLGDIRPDVVVRRSFALDVSRHLSLRGRYPGWLALPDRWASWLASAIPVGLALVRRYRPDILWSTYPIATAHLVGLALNRLTGIPWVADFRDPMTDEAYPPELTKRKVYRWIERKALTHCTLATVTTRGTLRMWEKSYPHIPRARLQIIANGYDEEDFCSAELSASGSQPRKSRVTLVHSGVVYPSERDPRALFGALAKLRLSDAISEDNFRIVLRATGHDEYLRKLIVENGIEDIVKLEPAIPYRFALKEMLDADGLLLMQASNCNHQIPAKLYEYIRARRPVLALTDPGGDTAAALREVGLDSIVKLDSEREIMEHLQLFLCQIRAMTAPLPSLDSVASLSRRARTFELGRLFDSIVEGAKG